MQQNKGLTNLNRMVWTSLLAALTAVGAYLQLPLGPIPFSLQPLIVMMAGLIMGPVGGAIVLCLYVGAGLVGLPVFVGGKSGFAHLLGPTGGYLIGFIAQAALTGMATRKLEVRLPWLRGILWGLAGLAAVYIIGVAWLKIVLDVDWLKAMTVGFLPFAPGDLVKLAAAVAVYRFMQDKRLLPK